VIDNLIDLLKKMLYVNYKQRISPTEALNHIFFKDKIQEESIDNKEEELGEIDDIN